MDEMPGMIRPDLQALPQVKDRMTFLYLKHCTLGRQDGAITVTSFPRIREGDPETLKQCLLEMNFSPHTRGCSRSAGRDADRPRLFPAHAGVILS